MYDSYRQPAGVMFDRNNKLFRPSTLLPPAGSSLVSPGYTAMQMELVILPSARKTFLVLPSGTFVNAESLAVFLLGTRMSSKFSIKSKYGLYGCATRTRTSSANSLESILKTEFNITFRFFLKLRAYYSSNFHGSKQTFCSGPQGRQFSLIIPAK